MEKNIKLWQFVFGLIAVLVSLGTIVFNQATVTTTHAKDIEFLKQENQNMNSKIKDLTLQIKEAQIEDRAQHRETSAKLTEILIKLENKQNKK